MKIIIKTLLTIFKKVFVGFFKFRAHCNFFVYYKKLNQKMLMAFIALIYLSTYSQGSEPITLEDMGAAIEITDRLVFFPQHEGDLIVSTAPDSTGIVKNIKVRSAKGSKKTNWSVFSLVNNTNQQIDKLIVAPYYQLFASGLILPSLDKEHIIAITPSEGFSLEKIPDNEADVFLVTINPGSVITFVVEQDTSDLSKLYIWDPNAYKDAVNSYNVYRGIVLGIAGLLAIFMTIFFIVKRLPIFPATASLAWSVLIYVCVDFNFLNEFLEISISSKPVWRAISEICLSASLIIFIYVYLNLKFWDNRFSNIALWWLISLAAFCALAFIKPSLASGLARSSFFIISILSAVIVFWLTTKRYDRAIMLIPTWLMIIVWATINAIIAIGIVENNIIQPALSASIVLIVMLIGLTVTQYAFASSSIEQGMISDMELKSLAFTGANATIWDWNTNSNHIKVGNNIARILRIPAKDLNVTSDKWYKIMHSDDYKKFLAILESVSKNKRGFINKTLRLKNSEDKYCWFEIKARPVINKDGKVIRCIGTIEDKTTFKNAQERIIKDTMYDHLTGLPSIDLFVKRLEKVMFLMQDLKSITPSIMHISIDGFGEINDKFNVAIGDILLLIVSRRLERLITQGDELARYQGDQFILMILSKNRIAEFASKIKKEIEKPIKFANESIALTACIGIAGWSKERKAADQFIADAELATTYAKKLGNNKIELFHPSFNETPEAEKKLTAKIEISILFKPIVKLSDREIVGYEVIPKFKQP